MEGYITRMPGEERYVFSDGTGEVVVKIDSRFFINHTISEKTRVELYGEVEKGLPGNAVIDVQSLSIMAPL